MPGVGAGQSCAGPSPTAPGAAPVSPALCAAPLCAFSAGPAPHSDPASIPYAGTPAAFPGVGVGESRAGPAPTAPEAAPVVPTPGAAAAVAKLQTKTLLPTQTQIPDLTENPNLFMVKSGFPLTVVQTEKITETNSEVKPLCLPDWSEIQQNTKQDESFGSLNGQLLAMPVRYSRNSRNPQCECLSHHDIKELRQAVKDSGLSSPYFNNVVKSIFNSYDLVPADCKNVASMILTNLQYILWDLEWKRLLVKLIDNYEGTPYAHFTLAQLAGDDPYDKAEDQAGTPPRNVLRDIKNAARKALLTVEPAGSHMNAYSTIRQDENEAYGAFLDQLTQAVERECPDEQAHPYLIQSLALANANEECKKIILALPDKSPAVLQMLSACSRLNTPQHLARVQANALGEQIAKSQDALGESLGKNSKRSLRHKQKSWKKLLLLYK